MIIISKQNAFMTITSILIESFSRMRKHVYDSKEQFFFFDISKLLKLIFWYKMIFEVGTKYYTYTTIEFPTYRR